MYNSVTIKASEHDQLGNDAHANELANFRRSSEETYVLVDCRLQLSSTSSSSSLHEQPWIKGLTIDQTM